MGTEQAGYLLLAVATMLAWVRWRTGELRIHTETAHWAPRRAPGAAGAAELARP